MIQTDQLCKDYDGKPAVVDLNLDVAPGELFCFLGPNGAGKTTTIKMLAGLLIPTQGAARVAGFDLQRHPVEAKRRIGYIPDRPYLYEKLSGRDFFTFVGDLFGIPRPVQQARLELYFDLFRLTPAADQFIENYSHGMRQKLVFAAALMHEPQVLIVDEPMVGLDPQSARTVKQVLREQADAGRTIFLSTHTLSVAEELADRIGVINKGQLVFLGTIRELRARLARDGSLEDLFLLLTEEETADV
ncbi:MAG TPA: ABC transporter ATP-binding protein [Candidatus Sumerlaeota bacterium]|nr:ABC transporter ATP-binding protein [Candidatus Sumerlaeota bacterium]HOR28213.1 ABC transporter ATP-binding protein [Candidatus Sumerlaeota bacterium]